MHTGKKKPKQFRNSTKAFPKLKSRVTELFPILAVLLFALSLRLILFSGVLDYDVLDYAYLAYDGSFGNIHTAADLSGVIIRYGLYLPVALSYAIFGPSENATILYPLLASLMGIACIYGIGRLQANESAGILAALIWAAFPLNVFLSTLFGPDSLLSNFTIAAVFFLLWGDKLTGRAAFWRYFLAGFSALVAFLVKPSAVIILVFFATFAIYKIWPVYHPKITRKISGITSRDRTIWAGMFLILFLGLAFIYVKSQPLLVHLLYATAADLSSLFLLGATQEYFPVVGGFFSTDLFLVAAPLFISALAFLIAARQKGAFPLILWAASCFFYFEWGSRSLNPARYAPFLAYTNDRNVLFLFAPFAVLAGIFYSQAINKKHILALALIAMLLIPVTAWILEINRFEGLPLSLLTLAVAASIIGTVLLPYLIKRKERLISSTLAGMLFIVTLLAFLYPTPPLHVSNEFWQRQIAFRRTVTQASRFLLDNPDYPVFTLSRDNAQELNFVSNFQLGHRLHLISEELPDARIEVISDPRTIDQSGYIFLRDELNQVSPVPSHWWKVAEFYLGTEEPIVIFRVLTPQDAAKELAAAIRGADENPSRAYLDALLGAAINSGDVEIAMEAWVQLNQIDPTTYTLQVIAPLVIEQFKRSQLASGPNLLDPELHRYEVDEQLAGQIVISSEAAGQILTANIGEDLQGHYGVYSEIPLQSESVYVFLLEVRSTTGVDVLRIASGQVPDSHDYNNVYGEWNKVIVVFVAPPLSEGEEVRLDLFTVNKKGVVSVKNPQLFLLQKPQH